MDENLTPEEKAKLEIEFLKLKLSAEHGGQFMSGTNGLPPEIELQFLQNIAQFESEFSNSNRISVFEIIGNPVFVTIEQLNSESLKLELEKLFELLNDNSLSLHYDHEKVSDETIYKFITEELINEEIQGYVKMEGGFYMFDYREYYPDHEDDIENQVRVFFKLVFENEHWEDRFLSFVHENEILLNNYKFSLEEYSEKMAQFKSEFKNTKFTQYQILSLEYDIDTEIAIVKGSVLLDSNLEEFSIKLTYSYALWCISSVDFKPINVVL